MTSPRTWPQILDYYAKGIARTLQKDEDNASNYSEEVAEKAETEELKIPTPAQFSAFINLGLCPHQARWEADLRLNRLMVLVGEIQTPDWPRDLLHELDDTGLLDQIPEDRLICINRITSDGTLELETLDLEDGGCFSIPELELARDSLPEEIRCHSLMVPLIKAWLMHPEPLPIEPEQRRDLILPEPMRYAVPSKDKIPVPAGAELAQAGMQPAQPAYLPGLEPRPASVVPVLPLRVAEESTAGRAAAIAPRIWFGSQLAMSLIDRRGGDHLLPLTLRQVAGWIWPHGWNRGRDLPRLITAFGDLVKLGITWNRRDWLLVTPVVVPRHDTQLDDQVLVRVFTLPNSDRGPMIDTETLWELGVKGSVPWRMWIRLAYLWDDVKRRNWGYRVYATRPKVERGPNGVILDKNGAPVLKRGDRPVFDWSDSRAVRTGEQEPHPQADRVPLLNMVDLALLGFDNAPVSDATVRVRAKTARDWLIEMERLKLVTLGWYGTNVRVLEPYRTDLDRNFKEAG